MPTLRLGDTAPDFEHDSSFGRIRFHEWLGDGWGVLIAPPADRTLDDTVDPGHVAWLTDAFGRRGAKLIVLSAGANEPAPANDARFPVVADPDHAVGHLFDVTPAETSVDATVPSVLIIDPAKKIRATISYPAARGGHDAGTLLRVFDALQA
jgi:alkyl hydroperoxide reductase subunit AhpC